MNLENVTAVNPKPAAVYRIKTAALPSKESDGGNHTNHHDDCHCNEKPASVARFGVTPVARLNLSFGLAHMFSSRSHGAGAPTRGARRVQKSTSGAGDLWVFTGIRIGQRVFRILQIRHQVVRRPTGGTSNVRITYDRLVECDERLVNQRQGPAVVLT